MSSWYLFSKGVYSLIFLLPKSTFLWVEGHNFKLHALRRSNRCRSEMSKVWGAFLKLISVKRISSLQSLLYSRCTWEDHTLLILTKCWPGSMFGLLLYNSSLALWDQLWAFSHYWNAYDLWLILQSLHIVDYILLKITCLFLAHLSKSSKQS